jgi:putative toxin-antitoxin system antitoxin component (TIGR02293 family)
MAQQIYSLPTRAELLDDARKVFEDDDSTTLWLNTPNEYLGGLRPWDVMGSGERGRELVRDLLESIKLGLPA